MREYWEKAERLRRRIKRKINEIHVLRLRAEGMNGSGINDMPRTTSPDPHKIDSTVFKIMSLEQEVSDMQTEYDALLAEAERRIDQVNDYDLHDLLVKRYLEFKTWTAIAAEFGYSVQNIYRLHAKALEKLRVCESS